MNDRNLKTILLQYNMELAEINDILQQFSLEAVSFKDISEGGFSGASIFLVNTTNADYVLKGHESTTDEERINFVHEVMNEAYRNEFRKLPRLIKTKSGKFTLNTNGRMWEVMTVIQGTTLQRMPNEVQCIELGKAVAELHRSLSNFPEEKVLRRRGVVTYESLIAHHEHFTDAVHKHYQMFVKTETSEMIATFIATSKDVLNSYFVPDQFDKLQTQIPRLVIHQDLWRANIFFKGDIFTGFIDFINAKHCVRIDEIAKLIIEVTDLSEKETSSFLRSYNSIWAFTTEEKNLFLSWILNWVIFSPFWHVELFIEKKEAGLEDRTRFVEMIERSQKILDRLKNGELDYLNEGAFLG